MTPSQPARDSRVEKLAGWFTRQHGTVEDHRESASQLLATFESAGLLVLDPNSEALVERIAETVYISTRFVVGNGGWDHLDDRERSQWRARSRAVLAAPAERPSGGAG